MDQVKIALQYAMPKHLLSRLVGYLAAARLGFISHALINLFIKAYKINMAEAQFEKASDYASFNEFFTRPLKDGLRPIDTDDDVVCQPVDGAISQLGDIVDGKLIQAKNHNYSLQALLGGRCGDISALRRW